MSNNASLNHIYRTVWNQALGAMVAVAEIESAGGPSGGTRVRNRANSLRSALRNLALPPGLALMPLSIAIGFSGLTAYFSDAHAQTLPQGGVAIHGTATSSYSQPGKLTVTTTNGAGTSHSATNWNSFSIGAGATTQINQPSAASMSINRVVTHTPSLLFGTLSSNGRVVLVNQSGIAVGAGALIDTAGFTASAVGMKDADALAGRLRFGGGELGNHTGALTVEGNIIARGGDVVLIAPSIDLARTAVVEAHNGSVSLVAGQSVEITGRGLEGITLSVQAPTDQAINLGSLKGDAVGIFAGTLKHSGLIQAVTADLQGGKVVLRATGDARVDGNAQVLARGDAAGAKGGTVDVLGSRVAVTGNALIDVSGPSGGGKIRVGGGFQGKDADVPNASRTYVGPNATLKADAQQAGDGGTVIVWADEQTKAYGSISAQGGPQGGDGGFVEVSGKQRLTFEAKVNALAPHGKSGTLLLDPNNITVVVGGGNVSNLTDADEFSDTPGEATINAGLINSAGATVILQANDDINVDAAISMANPGVGVTMQAGRYLAVNQTITTKAGPVTLVAHDPGSQTSNSEGAIYVNAAIDTTSAGSFPGGANISLTNDSADTGSSSIYLNANLNAGSVGTVGLHGLWVDQTASSAITAANLGVLATAGGADLNNPGNFISGNVAINAQGTVNFRNTAPNFMVSSVGGANGITGTGPVVIQTTGSMDTEQPISSSGGSVSIFADGGVSLGDDLASVPGTVTIDTSGGNGNIVQTGGSITAGSRTELNAGLGDITLGSTGNSLNQLEVTQAGILNIQNGSSNMVLDTIAADTVIIASQGSLISYGNSITGGLGGISITSTGGAINLAADGAASLASQGQINVSAASWLALGSANSVSQGVTLTAGGAITQADVISAANALVINAGTNSVTLNEPGNYFGGLSVTGGTVSITHDTASLQLGNVAANSFTLVNGGQISQSGGTSIVADFATFSAGAGNITLANAGNNVGTLTINPGLLPASTGNVTWYNIGPLALGEVNANNLTVTTAGGAIAQTAALTRVANAATFDTNHAGNVILNNSGNDFGSLSLNVGLAEIRDANSMTLATITAHELDLQAAGTLTMPSTAISVTNDLSLLSGTSLTILNNLSGANVYLQSNSGDIILNNTLTATGLLSMAANNGSITATPGLFSVIGTTAAFATYNITMGNPGNVFGGNLFLEGAHINVQATSSMNISQLNLTGTNESLHLAAGGALTLPAGDIDTGSQTLTLKSGASLTTPGNLAGSDVYLESGNGDLTLAHNVSASGSLGLKALNGYIFQTGGVVTADGPATVDAGTRDVSLNNSANIFDNISLTGYNLTLLSGSGITITSMRDGTGPTGVNFGNVFIVANGQLNLPAQDILADGQVTLNSAAPLTTQGVIQGTDIILYGHTGLNINHDVTASGFLNLEAPFGFGGVQQAVGTSITVAGHTSVVATGGGGVTLNQASNSFTSLSANSPGNAVVVSNGTALALGNVSAYSLDVTTQNAAVTQMPSTAINLGSYAYFDTGTGNVTLTNTGNTLTALGIGSAGLVSVKDESFSLALLASTADGINIENTAGSVTSNAAIDVGAGGLTVNSTGSIDFRPDGSAVVTSAGEINLAAVTDIRSGSLSGTDIGLYSISGHVSLSDDITASGSLNVVAGTYVVSDKLISAGVGGIGVTAGSFIDFSPDSQAILTSGGEVNLTADGSISSGEISGTVVSVNAGASLYVSGPIAATTSLSLEAASGGIAQSGFVDIVTPDLTASATGGDVALGNLTNSIDAVSASSTGDILIGTSGDIGHKVVIGSHVTIESASGGIRNAGGYVQSTVGDSSVGITLIGRFIGEVGGAAVLVKPGTAGVALTANDGDIFVRQGHGEMDLFNYYVSSSGAGKEIRLVGSADAGAHVNLGFLGWDSSTDDDNIGIFAQGANANVNINGVSKTAAQFAIGAVGAGGAVLVGSDGAQLDAVNGLDLFSLMGDVSLDGDLVNHQGFIRLTAGGSIAGNGFTTITTLGKAFEATANSGLVGPYGSFVPSGSGGINLDNIHTYGANGTSGGTEAEAIGQNGGDVSLVVSGGPGTVLVSSISSYGGNSALDGGDVPHNGASGGNVLISAAASLALNVVMDTSGGAGSDGSINGSGGANGGNAGNISVVSTAGALNVTASLYAIGGNGGTGTESEGNFNYGGSGGNAGTVSLSAAGNLNFSGSSNINNTPGAAGLDSDGNGSYGAALQPIVLSGSSISQSPSAAVNAAGMIVRFAASAGSVILSESGNLFGEMDGTATGNVSIVGLSGVGDLGVTAGGNLSLTGLAAAELAIQGPLLAGNISLTGYTIRLADDITSSGALDLTSYGNCGCGIDQTQGTILVTGLTTFTTGTDPVMLGMSTNDFNVIQGTGGDIHIDDANSLTLGAMNVASLDVTAGTTIAQTGALVTVQGLALGAASFNSLSASNISLTHAANEIGTLQILNGGAVSVVNATPTMVLADVTADTFTLASSGDIFNQPSATSVYTTRVGGFSVESTSGAVVLGSASDNSNIFSNAGVQVKAVTGLDLTDISVTAGLNATVTLASLGGVLKASGALVDTSGGQRWLTYLANPADTNHVFGPFDPLAMGAGDFRQVNAPIGTAPAQVSGNGSLWSDAPVVNLTLGGAVSKTYDGLTSISTAGATVASASGLLFNEADVDISGATAALADKHAGTGKSVTFSGTFGPAVDSNSTVTYGYQFAPSVTGNIADVAQATRTVTAQTDSRSYDGTTTSSVAPSLNLAVFAGDTVGSLGSQSFDSKHAGTGKTLTPSGFVANDGNGGNNYAISYVPVSTGSIAQAALTVTAQTDSRTYDGTTTSAATPGVSGSQFDAIGTAATQSFDTKHAGAGKTLTAGGLVMNDGNGGNNYAISYVPVSTGSIAQAALTVTAQTDSRTYDGSTTSAATPGVSGSQFDAIGTAATQSFDTKHAGAGKTLTAGGLVMNDGNGGNNYAISYVPVSTGSIAQAALTVTAQTDSRTYDGSTTSAAAPGVSGSQFDAVGTAATQSFDTKHAGSGKTLSASGLVMNDGNGGNNYAISYVPVSTGSIAQAALTVTAQTDSRSYDATTASAAAPVLNTALFAGDTVGSLGSQAFDTKHAGTGKTLTPSGFVANDGNGGGNYLISYVTNNSGEITPAARTVTAQTDSKSYDATTASAATPVLNTALFAGDTVGSLGSQAFDTKHAGTGKTLTASGFVANDGNGGNNYLITYAPSSAGVVNQASRTVTAQTDSRSYDGTTASSAAPVLNTSLFAGDTVGSLGSQAFDTKHAGTGKTLTASGFVANDGNGGGNYLITYAPSSTGSIAQAALTVTAQNDVRPYDGTTNSTVSPIVSGSQFDSIGTSATQTFDTKHAGTGKTLTAGGLVMNDGNGGNNYAIAYNTVGTGTVTKAIMALSAAADSKTYDGNTTSTGVVASSGLLGGDTVSGTSQVFGSKNVMGTGGSTLIVASYTINDGNSGGNYLVSVNSSAGTIGKANLSLSAATDSKTYDGTTTSTGLVGSSGLVGGDTVGGTSQAFASKNAMGAGGSTLQVASYTVNDGNSGNNYNLTTNTATGTISKANLTVSAVTDSKTYDGSTTSSAAANAIGLVGGDTLGSSSQSFASKNALGTGGSTLQVDSFAVNDGNGGNNYNVTSNTATGTINKASLTISATADSKTYDGNASSAGIVGSSGLVVGDSVIGASQVFDSKNAGSRTLSVGGYTVSDGNSGNNYNVLTSTASGTIGKADLTLSAAMDSKTYDGSKSSVGVVSASGLVAGDTVTGASQEFASKNVLGANASTLSVKAGFVLNDGNGGGNYNVLTNTAAGTIGKATLSAVTGVTADSKTYDGNTTAVVNTGLASAVGVIGPDIVAVAGGTGSFSDKNAGLSKLVTVSGLTLGGADAGNYQFAGSTTTTADITKAQLTGVSGVTAIDKTYDGNAVATLNTSTASIAGLVSGDAVTVLSGVGAFSDRHVGNGKVVSIVGINLGGPDGGNYTFGSFSSTASASITQRALSTWTGSVNNQWSNPGNWDALPDAGNVRAVAIPAGAQVVYDSFVGATQLERILSGGRLLLNSGSLTVSDTLRTFQFGQSGGLLDGAGQLIVEDRFAKSGGAINMGGLVDITQSSGVLDVGGIRGGNLLLKAQNGGITQGGPLATPGVLGAQATEAIVLNNPGNNLSGFAALTTSGNVELANFGPLVIEGIYAQNGNIMVTNTGGVITRNRAVLAPAGSVKITANSPITIGAEGITALGDIELNATNLTSAGNMVLNGNLISTGGGISLNAANNLTQNSSLAAAGAITAQAGGAISFGPVAISSGNPVSYMGAAGAVGNPPASLGELIARNSGGGTGGGAIDDFLSRFEDALDTQQNKSDDDTLKKKTQGDVVVEGETCRP